MLLGLTQKTGRGDETVDKKTTIGFTIVRVSNFNVFGFFSIEKKVPSVILVIIRFCICGCANSNNSYTPSSFLFFCRTIIRQNLTSRCMLEFPQNLDKTTTPQCVSAYIIQLKLLVHKYTIYKITGGMEPSSQNAQTAHTGSSEILHIQKQPFHLPASHPQEGTLHHVTVHV